MAIFPDLARAAIRQELAGSLGIDPVAAAAGILDIVNVNMMGALRVVSVEQGEDPRDFTLVAFGGAGPLHAADIARNMGMKKVLVPPRPGLLSAIGLPHADVRGDFSVTRMLAANGQSIAAINAGLAELHARGDAWLRGENTGDAPVARAWLVDMRYLGQNFELSVALDAQPVDARTLGRLVREFHRRHKEFYGYDMQSQPIEIVNLRLSVSVNRPPPPYEQVALRGSLKQAQSGSRQVWFPETGFALTPIYARELLPAEAKLQGPCIVEQMDTTTVVPPGASLRVDALGYLHIEVAPLREHSGNGLETISARRSPLLPSSPALLPEGEGRLDPPLSLRERGRE